MMLLSTIFVNIVLLAYISFAQDVIRISSSSSSSSSSISSSTVSSTLPSATTVDAPLPADNSTVPEEAPVACTQGNVFGYMLIRKPNITSLLTIGTPHNISWDWSVSVTKPPTYVDVYIQLMAPGVRTTWKQKIAEKQTVEPRWFMWTPEGLLDGKYKIRLVPDGKETFDVPANLRPCTGNGETIPSVSASFTLSNPRGDLANYPDQFPPNSAEKLYVSIILVISLSFSLVLTIM